MPWFRKSKSVETPSPVDGVVKDKRSIEATFKNDLLGVDDFKRSKIGFITGFSAANKAVSTLGNSITEAGGRINGLYTGLTRPESGVPSFEDNAFTADARERFIESTRIHRLREGDLLRIVRNTARQGWTYFAFTILCVAVCITTYFIWPPAGFFSAFFRLGPMPLFAALTFKSFFTNWMVRNRILTGPGPYFRSGDWFPRTTL
jgi:hypothetical protein